MNAAHSAEDTYKVSTDDFPADLHLIKEAI